jgi:hypothetical protein
MRNESVASLLMVATAFTAIGLLPVAASASEATGYATVDSLKIEIRGPGGAGDGTCILIDRAVEGSHVVGYFLTARRLFDPSLVGAWRSHELRVRVFLDDTTVVDVDDGSVTFPADSDRSADLALVKAPLPRATDRVAPVSFASPAGLATFLLKGHRSDRVIVLTGIARSVSSEPATAQLSMASDPTNCLGAAAISEAGVFGIATECTQGQPAVITLLSAARTFLTRVLPTWQPYSALSRLFRLERQSVDPFSVATVCEKDAAEFDVPLRIGDKETVVGATATVTGRKGVSLGEVTVMSFNDRVVRLRFSMPANQQAKQTDLCGADHALITIGVHLVVVPRQ